MVKSFIILAHGVKLNAAVFFHGIFTLGNVGTVVNYHSILITLAPDANFIKPFTSVIYCHSKKIPPFCSIKLYYLSNYHGMAVNNQGISFITLASEEQYPILR